MREIEIEYKNTVEQYRVILSNHSFTPNIDEQILKMFSEAKSLASSQKNYFLELLKMGMTRLEARRLSRDKFSKKWDLAVEINKLLEIKVKSKIKQKKQKELKEWAKGFDKFGRYKN